ncbi:glycoside hydrolase [Staphylotrichum tortipilum]|uniref:Mannan endo-1,6-alpha-mannosidase n=1 Tax=Staphylotrichum tortipilum TaxID=2831512 RepID=A0AAN6RT03_9PEZI|nr:glycoside hydrolase [Staphylotrichum longicolle]
MVSILTSRLAIFLAATCVCAALDVDLTSVASIQSAANVVAQSLLSYYHGDEPGQVPGILPGPPQRGTGPYYWWEGDVLWGTMVDYWHYTNDTTFNEATTQALLFQSEDTYNSANWSLSMGNDDQGFWAMSAMLAAEVGYPDPPADQPQWLALAQGVFNNLVSRWEPELCGGGLRWQVFTHNVGFDYKNTIATGIMFNIGARLARYTRNDSYATWAERSWDWLVQLNYIDDQYNVYDSAHIGDNCTIVDKAQFSYNAAVLAEGLAYMYAYTNASAKWQTPLAGLVNRTLEFFFPDGIMIEQPCERPTTLAPFVADPIMAALQSSAAGAAKSCNPNGTCGFRWTTGAYDGNTGAGQQMSALAALMSLLVTQESVPPLTESSGGTSKGDPGAGNHAPALPGALPPITMGDRVGAGILTTFLVASLLAGMWWLMRD